jgi:hypothetical protein
MHLEGDSETVSWTKVPSGFSSNSFAPSTYVPVTSARFRGARNVFRLLVDPSTLRATKIERLTTGTENEVELALSRDGKRITFTSGPELTREWIFPFDSARGQLTGKERTCHVCQL